METYIIQPGDTLRGIAMDIYGDAGMWREIADINDIRPPYLLKVGKELMLPNVAEERSVTEETPTIIESGKYVYYYTRKDPTKRVLGKTHRKGLYRIGANKTEEFITNHSELLSSLKMSQSEINCLIATSENEGNLDAINTWDNAYLSFACFNGQLGRKETLENFLPY